MKDKLNELYDSLNPFWQGVFMFITVTIMLVLFWAMMGIVFAWVLR